jgi:hypothetical protein
MVAKQIIVILASGFAATLFAILIQFLRARPDVATLVRAFGSD